MLSDQSPPEGILNRMIFSQMITIMEAYLSYKIRDIVMLFAAANELKSDARAAGKEVMESLLTDFGCTSYSEIFQVLGEQVVYHDLESVDRLFKTISGHELFPPEPNIRLRIKNSIMLRHDCIHRNGRSTHGVLQRCDEHAIRCLAGDIDILVKHIESVT